MGSVVREVASITSAAAFEVIRAALAAADAMQSPSAIAVVDPAGNLTAFTRMDGAAVQAIQVAQDKAYTAAGFGMPTGQWHELLAHDAPLAAGAPAGIARLIPFGGGLPITVDGVVIGGIGVSGGHWSQDHAVAEEAVRAVT